ncbi:hypothetical protein [Actinosynnema mirum]|nr:hypothetical protein [Actinosynnema mirum]
MRKTVRGSRGSAGRMGPVDERKRQELERVLRISEELNRRLAR